LMRFLRVQDDLFVKPVTTNKKLFDSGFL
jgi:hypothetical protein